VAAVRQSQPSTTSARHEEKHTKFADAAAGHQRGAIQGEAGTDRP